MCGVQQGLLVVGKEQSVAVLISVVGAIVHTLSNGGVGLLKGGHPKKVLSRIRHDK
jgi:hypothetical protein